MSWRVSQSQSSLPKKTNYNFIQKMLFWSTVEYFYYVNVIHLYSAICIASEALFVIYTALPPKGACGSASWVLNATHDYFHYRRMWERIPANLQTNQVLLGLITAAEMGGKCPGA